MEVGESRVVNMLIRFLGPESMSQLDNFVQKTVAEDFLEFKTKEQIESVFKSKLLQFLASLSEDELLSLRSYTGYQFKNINAILRGNWTYERNGILSEEVRIKYFKLAEDISRVIERSSKMDFNFIVYRGVDISAFSKYGVFSLEQLVCMNGKYMYEEGFTSTSLLEETSYFKEQMQMGNFCNIEMKYLISSECEEGMLLNYDMSYSPNQNEYLINRDTLSKVVSVEVDRANNQAILTAVVIPKSKWNVLSKGDQFERGK